MNKILLYGVWSIFAIMNFPVLLLQINYWFTDKNKVIQFDSENFCFDKSGPLKVNRRAPWSEYYYYQIELLSLACN